MPVVAFKIQGDSGRSFLVEAHGDVTRDSFSSPYEVDISAFYVSHDGDEWLEVGEHFISCNVDIETFRKLCSDVEEAMIEAFQHEEGLEADESRIH
jgi:hypothetical protein